MTTEIDIDDAIIRAEDCLARALSAVIILYVQKDRDLREAEEDDGE